MKLTYLMILSKKKNNKHHIIYNGFYYTSQIISTICFKCGVLYIGIYIYIYIEIIFGLKKLYSLIFKWNWFLIWILHMEITQK